jgi:hypothetical protein
MPRPISPVVKELQKEEVLYGASQTEYQNLPALRLADGTVVTRWRFSLKERLQILFRGDLYLWTKTFKKPFQPVLLDVEKPQNIGGLISNE